MKLTIGSRGSKLALWQANFIKSELERTNPGSAVEIRIIKTTGDKISESALADLSGTGKGVFVKEIEEALLHREVDLAVHSLKDVPTDLSPEFCLACIPERADVRDALIAGSSVTTWADLPRGARLGTSSMRRTVQLKFLRADLEVEVIRGNVDTRLRKRDELGLDGIILAGAGLKRLGLDYHISYLFPAEEMVPAIGQGALAIETRAHDTPVIQALEKLEHESTRICVEAERAFLKAMGGGCQVPMGGYASIEDGSARFTALVASPTDNRVLRHSSRTTPDQLTRAALDTADVLLSQGADRILKELGLYPI